MVAMRVLLVAAAAVGVHGHGWMTHPPSRNGGNLTSGATAKCVGFDSAVGDCNWFTSSTTIPGEPTLCDPELLTVLNSIEHNCSDDHARDFTRKHPWRAPGTAPVIHPCGTHCTSNSPGSCFWGNVAGPIWGFDSTTKDQINWTALPPQEPTVWKRGSAVEVAAGIAILHSGGWSYRLCAADAELTEECFQRGALLFTTDSATVRPIDSSTAPFTIPVRHTSDRKWTRIPVPATNTEMPARWCKSPFIELQKENGANWTGGDVDRYMCDKQGDCNAGDDWCWKYGATEGAQCCDCKGSCIAAKEKPAFAPPFKKTDGLWNYSIVETVDVPADLQTGDYVLSWRWDAEATPQVWVNCADIKIVD